MLLYSTEKSYTYPYSPVFFIVSTVKSFETLPRHYPNTMDMNLFRNFLL